jgi:cyanosortase A-associated protein
MNSWKTVRIWLLAVIFTGILYVFFKIVLFPSSKQLAATPTPFVFPATVPLPLWQLQESVPLKITDDPNFFASRRYRYQQDRISLNIDMHYIVQARGDIDVKKLLKAHIFPQNVTTPLLVRKKPGVGFHVLFTNQGKAYLSTCLNSRGGSTVTEDQFRRNRNAYDVDLGRLVLWLLGLKELRDWRCLWNVFSVPWESAKPDEAYSILESAWFSWFPWWEQHFPRP